MRGKGQIAELAEIAEPDVAVIVSIGPVHLELMGSIEAIAAAKAELIAALPPAGTAVIPANEPLLQPHLRDDVTTVTFGPDGDVRLAERRRGPSDDRRAGRADRPGSAVHAGTSAVQPARRGGRGPRRRRHPDGPRGARAAAGRGQRYITPSQVTVIDDCYNANPISMRAALDDLKATADATDSPRRVAVLGDMLELGPEEREFHAQLGEQAAAAGVDVLVTVGPLAASIADRFGGETHSVADAGEAADGRPGAAGAPGTSCSSRPRAGWASSSSAARSAPGKTTRDGLRIRAGC